MIDLYLDHLRVERRLADHTLESYQRDLRALAAFSAETSCPPERLDRPALEAFVRRQMSSGLSPRSVARSVAAIRGFFRFLVLDRRLHESPADDLQGPRAWPALPKFLSIEDVDALIAQPDITRAIGLRDRALIELLYATGMRVSELLGVRAVDLHLDEQYLSCIGKGNKERLIPIGEQAAMWIRTYQREGRPALLKRRSATRVFVNVRGGPLSRVGFWKILKAYGRHAGLWPFEKISPLLVPSVLTYRSEPAQLRHAWEEKAMVPPSGDHVGLANPPACTSVVSPSPFVIAMELLG